MRHSGKRCALFIAASLVLHTAAPAFAYSRPGSTELVSFAASGAEAEFGSFRLDMTPDGRHVAFVTLSSNLVPGDTNGASDVFVRDLEAGSIEIASVSSDGTQSNAWPVLPALTSNLVSISNDGRYVAFLSHATNLVPGDTNAVADIFVRDRVLRTTEMVSVAHDGRQGNNHATYPQISGNGRYVVWESDASNLVPGDTNDRTDIFLRDREAMTTVRLSVSATGAQTFGSDHQIATISDDGRYVAFHTNSGNLAPNDQNRRWDIYMRDLLLGTIERVSLAGDGSEGNGDSINATISDDGRYVAFYSESTNFVPAKSNTKEGVSDPSYGGGPISIGDIFVRDRLLATTERVSVSSVGAESNDVSSSRTVNDRPVISADGRFVAFRSDATNLVPGDTNGKRDVFVHDRTIRATERVSVGHDGSQNPGDVFELSIAADGSKVAFITDGALVPGDTNATHDAFIRSRGRPLDLQALPSISTDATGVTFEGRATLSGAEFGEMDPASDGLLAGPFGAESTGAEFVARPEVEDLLLRIRLASLPPVAGGAPGVLYGADFLLDGVPHEIRAQRVSTPAGGPPAALYRCQGPCALVATLTASFGTTAAEVLVSLPQGLLRLGDGPLLSRVRAFAGIGTTDRGLAQQMDDVRLPAFTPASRLEMALTPLWMPAPPAFDSTAPIVGGDFSLTIPWSKIPGPTGWAHARVCIGSSCGPTIRFLVPFH